MASRPQFGADPFPPTRWSVLDAAARGAAARTAALADVAERYGRALYAVARRRGVPAHDAEDAVQGFFAKIAADPSFFDGLDPARGRFRAFLRTAFERFVANLREAGAAAKRGADRTVAWDAAAAEIATSALPDDADRAFERAWAEAVVRRATERWRAERAADGRGAESPLLAAFLTLGSAPPPLADAARANGLTEAQLKSLVHRARVAFRKGVRRELAAEGTPEDELDAEVAALAAALAR